MAPGRPRVWAFAQSSRPSRHSIGSIATSGCAGTESGCDRNRPPRSEGMVQSPRLRNTPGGAKCFWGAGEGGRSLTTVGVCMQQQDRAAGGRVPVPAGLTRTRLPLVSRRGGPSPPAARFRCGSRGRGATGQRVRLSRGRVRVRVPPSPLEQGRGAGRPRRPHKPQIVGSNPTPAIVPTWLSGDGTGFVHRLRKDGVGSSPTVGSVTVAQEESTRP